VSERDQERDRELVAAALRAVGLAPLPEDIAALAHGYPELRAMLELLYGVDGAEDELPQPIVDP
jgi:hypothetical protein